MVHEMPHTTSGMTLLTDEIAVNDLALEVCEYAVSGMPGARITRRLRYGNLLLDGEGWVAAKGADWYAEQDIDGLGWREHRDAVAVPLPSVRAALRVAVEAERAYRRQLAGLRG